jgi:nucleoside phosphorylase
LGETADLIIESFGDSSGLLPGSLSLSNVDVLAILHEATKSRLAENSTVKARATYHAAIDTKRLFGGPMITSAFHVVMTPIRRIFEMLCSSLGATIREGWFPTALLNSSETSSTVIVCPPPGSSMAEDCLSFLLSAGRAQSLLFLGLAGSLTHQLDCGDIISPTYVLSSQHMYRAQQISAIPLGAMNEKPCTDSAWTVRSAPRLNDESDDLLKAWRWAGVDLIDLESSVVASFCATKEIPFSALLVVSDRPLDGVSLWAQPPFTSDAIVSRSIERVVERACEVTAGLTQAKLEKEQTYGFEIRH